VHQVGFQYTETVGVYSRIHKIQKYKNLTIVLIVKKCRAVPLQAWSGPEGSRKLRFPDFMTTAQGGSKVVSLTYRPPLPQEIHLVLISFRG
jgi:hypothetical protein